MGPGGRILQTPVCNLLGGRFRDRVRFYRTLQAGEERGRWTMARGEMQVQDAQAEKWGWTAFKFQGDGVPRQGRSRVSASPATTPTPRT